MAVFSNSRFVKSVLYKDESNPEIIFIDPIREPMFLPSKDDLIIQFVEGMRLDILAYELYGDGQLEWVFLDANPEYDSPLDFKPGVYIRAPLPERVLGNNE